MKTKSFFIAICILISSATAFGQAYEGTGRDPSRFNAALTILKPGSFFPGVLDNAGTGSYNNWCTSFLAPEGIKPVRTPEMDIDLRDYEWAVHEWECMYSPERAADNDPATAWCEGALDEGLGQAMIAHVDALRPVQIWSGFGKSQGTWVANCRPRKIQVTVLLARTAGAHQSGEAYSDIKAIAQHEVELKDLNGYQNLPIPRNDIKEENGSMTFVVIKIISVYPGTKYKDTLISEISNYSQE